MPVRTKKFAKGDEIVILTHSKNIPVLQERWQSKSEVAEAPDPEATPVVKP